MNSVGYVKSRLRFLRRGRVSCSQGCFQFFYVAEDNLLLPASISQVLCDLGVPPRAELPGVWAQKAPCSSSILTPLSFLPGAGEAGPRGQRGPACVRDPRGIPDGAEAHPSTVGEAQPPGGQQGIAESDPHPLEPSHCSVTMRSHHGHGHSHS